MATQFPLGLANPNPYGPTSVIGEALRSATGNLVLRIGRALFPGWEATEHVVLSWDEEAILRDALTGEMPIGAIRAEIARLEGELARLSGEWLSVWTGELGYDRSHADLPLGGCLVDWSTGIRDQAWQRWYPSLDAGKAALLAQFQETGGDLSEDGFNFRDTGPAGGCTMRITRRDHAQTCDHRIYSNPGLPSDPGVRCGKRADQTFRQPDGTVNHFCEKHKR